MLISKTFCEKFLKNLAREAKPARESFVGRGRVKMGMATWPGHGRLIVGAPILRGHLHVSWAPTNCSRKRGHTSMCTPIISRKFGRPFAPTFMRTWKHTNYAHTYPRTNTILGIQIYPHAPTFVHALPRSFGRPNSDWTPTFQATFGRPRIVLDGHPKFWSSIIVHEIGLPYTLLGAQ